MGYYKVTTDDGKSWNIQSANHNKIRRLKKLKGIKVEFVRCKNEELPNNLNKWS